MQSCHHEISMLRLAAAKENIGLQVLFGSQYFSAALSTLRQLSALLDHSGRPRRLSELFSCPQKYLADFGSSQLHQLCNVLPPFFSRQPLVQPGLGVHQ